VASGLAAQFNSWSKPLTKVSKGVEYEDCILPTVLSDPPWHKHQPDNTWLFRLNEDDKS
jgi:hypothetical protein